MRMQLSGLIRRVLLKDGSLSKSLQSRRQGQQSQGNPQDNRSGTFVASSGKQNDAECRCYGCTSQRAARRTH
jgi:hypothetical protein